MSTLVLCNVGLRRSMWATLDLGPPAFLDFFVLRLLGDSWDVIVCLIRIASFFIAVCTKCLIVLPTNF